MSFIGANELGTIREEIVASTVDAVTVTENKSNGDNLQSICLHLPIDITTNDKRNKAFVLQCVNSKAQCAIPAGSIIHKVIVTAKNQIDGALSFQLGYSSPSVKDNERKAALAVRTSGKPVSGTILNAHKQMIFREELVAKTNEALNQLYNDEKESNGEKQAPADYTCIDGSTCVGEREDLLPVLTVLSGSLKSSDLLFTIVYNGPISH